MTNTELKAKIEDVKSELTTLQAQLEGKKLSLEVDIYGDLCIYYGGDIVGWITKLGKCRILHVTGNRRAREQWVKGGKPVDTTIVEWRGGKYMLTDGYNLRRTDVIGGYIYDFTDCQPCCGCGDTNIQRYSDNNTPIMH